MFLIFPHLLMVVCRKITEKASKRAFGKQMIINSLYTTVQRNYPIGSVDLNRNHSSDVLV